MRQIDKYLCDRARWVSVRRYIWPPGAAVVGLADASRSVELVFGSLLVPWAFKPSPKFGPIIMKNSKDEGYNILSYLLAIKRKKKVLLKVW